MTRKKIKQVRLHFKLQAGDKIIDEHISPLLLVDDTLKMSYTSFAQKLRWKKADTVLIYVDEIKED